MHHDFPCPFCQRQLRLKEDHAGRLVRCPACAKTFVPGEDEPLDAIPVEGAAPEGVQASPPQAPVPRARRLVLSRAEEPLPARRGPWLLVGVLVICGGALVLLVGWAAVRSSRPAAFTVPAEDPELRLRDVRQAFHRAGQLADDELAAELVPLFEELGAAIRARDGQRAVAYFDLERMLSETTLGNLAPARPRNQANLTRGMRTALANVFSKDSWLPWVKSEVRNLRKLPNDEVVVIVRHRCDGGEVVKMRWWLSGASGAWKVYDLEDLDTGIRLSVTMSLIEQQTNLRGGGIDPAGLARIQEIARATRAVEEALNALHRNDADTAAKRLAEAAGVQMPAALEGLRLMAQGVLEIQQGRHKEALATLDRAHRAHPDMPVLDLLRGIVLTHLEDYPRALKYLQAYRDLLGEDPALCRSLGDALRGLSRMQEAAAAYRKALDEDPRDADAFLGLLRALTDNDPRDDVPARFARLPNLREAFVTCASDCAEDQDARGIEQMAEVLRKSDPDFAPLHYYLSLARAWRGKPDEAAGLFRSALAREKDAQKRKDWETGFLTAMAGPGKALAAYAAVADAGQAFRVLALRLKDGREAAELKRLVQAHAGKHPDDVLLPLCRGEMHVWEGNYPLAEKAFAEALARGPDRATLEMFRAGRVLARYHAGGALAAYRDIGPREETFEQLAGLLVFSPDHDALEALLEAHAKHAPASKELLRYRCRLKVRRGQTDEGGALFRKLLAAQTDEQQRKRVVSEFFADMLQAGKPVEAYQLAPDARPAFEELAENLFEDDRADELRRLIEAHRARHPDDPAADYYAGQLYLEEEAPEKAARALERGWNRSSQEQRERFRYPYVRALYLAGEPTRAYREVGPREATFEQLAHLLAGDGRAADLKQLVEVHRRLAGEDAALLFHEVRAELLMNRVGRAVALFQQAYRTQPNDYLRQSYASGFVTALTEGGRAVQAYRAAPDGPGAFSTAAALLLHRKRTAELLELLEEHGRAHPEDPGRLFQAGELYLLRGDLRQAEHYFAAALKKGDARREWQFRNGLYRARVRAGRTVQTYEEAESKQAAFADLASVCAGGGSTGELEALLAAHRRRAPDDPELHGWEVELCRMKKDDEGVCRLLAAHRATLLASPRWRWKFESYLVRALVRSKQTDQAVKEAEALMKTGRGDPLLLVLAVAAQGDVKRAITLVEGMRGGHARQRCYQDEDLAPLLRGEVFRAFRERFPEVKARAGLR